LRVVFTLASEVGIDLEAMADIANDQEWRPAFARWQRLGVLLRLLARVQHENVPGAGRGPPAKRGGLFRLGIEKAALCGFLGPRPAALLGLKDEGTALIEIDASARRGTVRFAKSNGALESIGVQLCVMRGLIGARHLQHIAKFRQEQRVIGAFLPAVAGRPAGYEGIEVSNRRAWDGRGCDHALMDQDYQISVVGKGTGAAPPSTSINRQKYQFPARSHLSQDSEL
jgi:hypothetical protein